MEIRDLFLSYNNKDVERAAWVADTLRAHGYTVYFQRDDCTGGIDFLDWMDGAIQHSRGFIAIWSRTYEDSDYCKQERNAALRRQHRQKDYRIIPVRFEDHRTENVMFDGIVTVDLRSPDEEKNKAELLRHISAAGYSPAQRSPYASDRIYTELFTEPLFLHKGRPDSKVDLLHLFVPQRFEIKKGPQETGSMDALFTRFFQEDIRQAAVLYIEGDAGCGKSSLAAYLNYYYQNDPDFRQRIFGDRELITVRLREIDIPAKGADANRLIDGILDQLQIGRGELRERPAALFLDGYDELCAVENLRDTQSALDGLGTLGCKVIVTSRPNYIRHGGLDHHDWRVILRHFDAGQREQWIDRYTGVCGETIDAENRAYLERINNDDDAAGICDTPMGLYMVAAGHFGPGDLENEWAMYHRIFYRELSERVYSPTAFHDIHDHRDELYRVSEEIAYHLFQQGNADLLVPDEVIQDIVRSLRMEDEGARKIVERSFALCTYWKTRTDKGCVEFYHNNIRDFFLCEKIMGELDRIYKEHQSLLEDEKADITPFLKELCDLFLHGDKVEQRVLDFIRQRVAYKKDDDLDLCAEQERERRFLPRIFETLLTTGAPYTIIPDKNPVVTVRRILTDIVRVYTSVYLPLLEGYGSIRWWNNVGKVNENGVLRQLAGSVLAYAPCADLRLADLSGADLRHADLSRADLRHADLRHADLSRADLNDAHLNDADLRLADLSGAYLRFADLRGAKLSGADLSGAYLRFADLRRADLSGAKLISADLRGAKLSGADLRNADLRNADLRGADLRNADLRNADLRGAYLSSAVGLGSALHVPKKYQKQISREQTS